MATLGKPGSKPRWILLGLLLLLLLPSCSSYRDAVVFNACREDVTVSFGASPTDEGTTPTLVAAGEGVSVLGVIADVGNETDTVRVESDSGDSLLIDVAVPDEEGPVPLGILPPECP